MIDMEKLLDGLHCRATIFPERDCAHCHYGIQMDRIWGCDFRRMAGDALKLLENMPSRNCVNCGHYEVCATVRERKAHRANNYTACEHWRRREDD